MSHRVRRKRGLWGWWCLGGDMWCNCLHRGVERQEPGPQRTTQKDPPRSRLLLFTFFLNQIKSPLMNLKMVVPQRIGIVLCIHNLSYFPSQAHISLTGSVDTEQIHEQRLLVFLGRSSACPTNDQESCLHL